MKKGSSEEIKRINRLTGRLDSAYHDAALKLGLSDSAMKILYMICSEGNGCLLSDICMLTALSKQTINSALRKLEAEGILFLQTAVGRKKRVYLTEKGKILAENTVMRIVRMENEIFSLWSDEELGQYIALTEKYLIALKESVKNL